MIQNELDIRLKPAIESTSSTKVPLDGEIVLVKDTSNSANNNIRIGNGSTAISSLSNFLTMGGQGGGGTVTSVRVQATSPVQSSESSAQSTTLNTTISLTNAYGDTKNPYGSKTANYVLAAPNGSAGAPSFRALVAADIPNLSWSKLTSGVPTTISGYGITDAYRPIQVGGTEIIGSSSSTALNLVAGGTVSIDPEIVNNAYTGKITISATGGGTGNDYKTTLNGTSYPSSPASGAISLGSWYAPNSAGTQYDLLQANSSGIPSWLTPSGTGLLKFTSGSGWSIDTNSYVTSNSASLQVSDTTNKRVNTSETTNKYLQFTGGTNKFTISDTTGGTGHSFDVAITPSVSWPSGISGLPANNTGCLYNNGTGTWSIHPMTYRGISVNGTNILTDSQSQYLNLVAGSNITLTPEQTGSQYTGKITIAASGGGSYTLPTARENVLGGLIVSSDTDADTGYRNLDSAVAVPVFYGTVSNMYIKDKGAEDYDMENPEQDVTTHYINVRDVVNGIIHDQEMAVQLKDFLVWLLQHDPDKEWPWW